MEGLASPEKDASTSSKGNAIGDNSNDLDIMCSERLDAKSPDLWPEKVPGITNFVRSQSPQFNNQKAIEVTEPEWLEEFDPDEMNLLYALGSLTATALLEKVKEYHNLAYELGLEESREMTRGRLFKVLDRPSKK
jgi:hypothetical protein